MSSPTPPFEDSILTIPSDEVLIGTVGPPETPVTFNLALGDVSPIPTLPSSSITILVVGDVSRVPSFGWVSK